MPLIDAKNANAAPPITTAQRGALWGNGAAIAPPELRETQWHRHKSATFWACRPFWARLSWARLSWARLSWARLSWARLSWARLSWARLSCPRLSCPLPSSVRPSYRLSCLRQAGARLFCRNRLCRRNRPFRHNQPYRTRQLSRLRPRNLGP
ncbi:MAG: hypothetical protein EXR77_05975 [Myxococcales bacterium]|nr:hypothetical protein [Myxococcales bacterium]